MFGRSRPTHDDRVPEGEAAEATLGDMALDTLASVLRSMAEFALEQDVLDIPTFRAVSEAWAKHITLATSPPGVSDDDPRQRKGRREWQGVRRFVREYCEASSKRVVEVATDLRQVIWVFIHHLSQTFTEDEVVDARVRVQLDRLEDLVQTNSTADLKREVLDVVGMLRVVLEERRERQIRQMDILGAQVRSLGHELESARRESETDPLTRISNRKAFDEYLARSVEIHRAFSSPMAMLVVDIDHFKAVNDDNGHITGDEVLREVADALVKVFLRKSDFVSRLGGDEFAVILRETTAVDARALAERVLGRIRALRMVNGEEEPIDVTVSIGLAAIEPGDDGNAWLERADRGLYAAKEAGRDRVASGF